MYGVAAGIVSAFVILGAITGAYAEFAIAAGVTGLAVLPLVLGRAKRSR